jgi:hypothetical protein
MQDPTLWIIFVALFILAGILNLARGIKDSAGKRNARIALALSCGLWAAASAAFRFAGDAYGLGIGAAAGIVMIAASILKMRDVK